MIEQTKGFVARVWVAGLVSATLGIGGVWFVVDQSLETLRGHVASIDRRMDEFVTKREFNQFLARFDALERRLEEQFDRTRAAYDRASVEVPDRERTFRVADGSIVSDGSAISIDATDLSADEREAITRNMTEILVSRPARSADITASDAASFLNLLEFEATVTGATTVRVGYEQ